MHASTSIVHFYVQQHFLISLSRFKSRYHKVVSLSPLIKSETTLFKNKFQVPMPAYTVEVIYCHQSNIIFLLFVHDLEYSIGSFILQSDMPILTRNHYI